MREGGILGTPMAWAVPQNKAAGGGLRHALDLLTAGTAQALVAGDLSRLVDGSASARHPSTRGKRQIRKSGVV